MTKIRVFMVFSTIIVVSAVGLFVSYYARGYRFSLKNLRFSPNGIFVIKSEPDGASVYINGELKGATNANLSLSPATYDVEVKKEGFFSWSKRIQIEKEIVTQATVSLFKNAPSLTPITFSGANNPVASTDGTKVVFSDKTGLWTTETYNLPIGFTNSPKKVTDGDMSKATYEFSPDGRQILLKISNGVYLIDSGSFTSQNELVNIASTEQQTRLKWLNDDKIKNQSLISTLPQILQEVLNQKGARFIFSPDDTMVIYTPVSNYDIPNNLIPQLPGSSTQKQERSIKIDQTYVYDIKEDRNFLISDNSQTLYWMPDSRHILNPTDNKIVIMDYDGTNRQVVYSGSYIAPNAFPYRNTTKLMILTNLGSSDQTPNLYELTIK